MEYCGENLIILMCSGIKTTFNNFIAPDFHRLWARVLQPKQGFYETSTISSSYFIKYEVLSKTSEQGSKKNRIARICHLFLSQHKLRKHHIIHITLIYRPIFHCDSSNTFVTVHLRMGKTVSKLLVRWAQQTFLSF